MVVVAVAVVVAEPNRVSRIAAAETAAAAAAAAETVVVAAAAAETVVVVAVVAYSRVVGQQRQREPHEIQHHLLYLSQEYNLAHRIDNNFVPSQ